MMSSNMSERMASPAHRRRLARLPDDGPRRLLLWYRKQMLDHFSTPVREYMSKALISVRPTAPIEEVSRVLEQRDISSVAVTDDRGVLVGIVSVTDLLRDAAANLAAGEESPRTKAKIASDLMKTPVITIDEDAPVREAAEKMLAERIHRVLVLRDERAVATLSTRDVMRAILFHHVDIPLSRVMVTPVETVDVGDPIDTAIARLGEKNVRGLVVVDGGLPVGVFTQTEALRARTLPREIMSTPVEQIMSYETICLDVATPLYRVAGTAIAVRCRRVLATEAKVLRGIVTGFDLLKVATTDLE
jgi:CBS domain-containing protein